MYKVVVLIMAAIMVTTISCHHNNKSGSKEITQKENIMGKSKVNSLGDMLKAKSIESERRSSAEKKKIYNEGIVSVANSDILKNALNVGDEAVDFILKNSTGKDVHLYEELKNGPVVLIWYRGGWCPYCNITLHYLQERLPDFKKAGASLLALTPELPDKSLSTSEKHNLQFEVLSDIGNKIGRKYGIIYKLTDDVAKAYNKSFDMKGYNGDDSEELPLAATYVIDADKIIKYAFLDADYKKRAEPDDIIEALNKLKRE